MKTCFQFNIIIICIWSFSLFFNLFSLCTLYLLILLSCLWISLVVCFLGLPTLRFLFVSILGFTIILHLSILSDMFLSRYYFTFSSVNILNGFGDVVELFPWRSSWWFYIGSRGCIHIVSNILFCIYDYVDDLTHNAFNLEMCTGILSIFISNVDPEPHLWLNFRTWN